MKQLNFFALMLALVFWVKIACSKNPDKKIFRIEDHVSNEKSLNILLITADDLGKQLSCYGDDIIKTPNMDKLAERGMLFHNAYVSQASCSSSRSSILTGIYPHTNGQMGLAHLGFKLKKEYPNLAGVLKQQGYTTGIIGKLHVNPPEDFPFDFDRKNYLQARDVGLVANRVDSFLTMSGENPFFLYLNYSDPHVPFFRNFNGYPTKQVAPGDVQAFNFQGIDNDGQLQRIADYYCCVRRLDEGIGLLQNQLEKHGVFDNTLIIFIGDHGAPFTRGKTASYESSVNIPYFVSCSGVIKNKQQTGALASTVDIFPTIMDALDLPISGEVQGKSLLPVLRNEKKQVRRYLFTEFNYHGCSINSFFPRRTVRDGRYKLVLNLPTPHIPNGITSIDGDKAYTFSRGEEYDGTWVREAFERLKNPPKIELFDLQNDPFEKNNLAGNPALQDKKKELLAEVLNWMAGSNDPFADENKVVFEIEKLKNGETAYPGYTLDK